MHALHKDQYHKLFSLFLVSHCFFDEEFFFWKFHMCTREDDTMKTDDVQLGDLTFLVVVYTRRVHTTRRLPRLVIVRRKFITVTITTERMSKTHGNKHTEENWSGKPFCFLFLCFTARQTTE
jgi:hypothetical protein